MRSITRTALVALSVTALLACASIVRADTSWPSDQAQQLAQLDAQLIDVQQKLFTAKQTNDTEGTDRFTAEFNACQSQRLTLLQAMGLVSQSDIHPND